ncbi:hypothetical protein [Cytobacillus praedii]|uniref:hypothetical protein n=1 Tax=Cytobacillus praedii TaxID=1742358 RepID=UPI003AF9F30E
MSFNLLAGLANDIEGHGAAARLIKSGIRFASHDKHKTTCHWFEVIELTDKNVSKSKNGESIGANDLICMKSEICGLNRVH